MITSKERQQHAETTAGADVEPPGAQERALDVKRSVLSMYRRYPFPQWSKEERRRRFASELCRYRFCGLSHAMKGARFLEVGCGTGNRSMLAAKHFGVGEFVGLDQSTASLEIARQVAREEHFERFTPVEGDLFNIPYPDGSFDVVVSWGVLHHTADPFRGFEELVRACRPGGFLGLFLYNKWNHWRHNLQKNRVTRLAGDDLEERFSVAHSLYGTTTLDHMSPGDIAEFYDKYCHVYKTDHTLGELIGWFDKLRLEYWGSYPPLRMRDAIACLQYRASLLENYPVTSSRTRSVLHWSTKLPTASAGRFPASRPTLLHRTFWQAAYAWMGRHGEYSGGAALTARKPEHPPA